MEDEKAKKWSRGGGGSGDTSRPTKLFYGLKRGKKGGGGGGGGRISWLCATRSGRLDGTANVGSTSIFLYFFFPPIFSGFHRIPFSLRGTFQSFAHFFVFGLRILLWMSAWFASATISTVVRFICRNGLIRIGIGCQATTRNRQRCQRCQRQKWREIPLPAALRRGLICIRWPLGVTSAAGARGEKPSKTR